MGNYLSFSKVMGLIATFLVICACAVQQAQNDEPSAHAVAIDPLLDKHFDKILISITTTPKLEARYHKGLRQCQEAVILALQEKQHYKQVDRYQHDQIVFKDTLLVKINVFEMRIVNSAARMFGRSVPGDSFMKLQCDFIDLETKNVLHKKELYSYINQFSAEWDGLADDHRFDSRLPSITGKIIADYIDTVIPKQ